MILAVFTDFDGTLVNIAKTPESVKVGGAVLSALQKLALSENTAVAVVTGRSLEDISKRVPLKNIILAGNHGLEIKMPGRKTVMKAEKYKKVISSVCRELNKKTCGIRGALIENKGVTLSAHYRLADKNNAERIKKIFFETAAKYSDKHNLEVSRGKKVLEIKPKIDWDKGKAVLWITDALSGKAKTPVLPVYIGDDITDEYAFDAVNGRGGISIFVGAGKADTNAKYRISSPSQVIKFLNDLISK